MTSAKKSIEALEASLKKAKERAAEIKKQLKQTELAEKAKLAIQYWDVIRETAIAKDKAIPSPNQLKKLLLKSFKDSAEEKASKPAKKVASKKPAAKQVAAASKSAD